MFSGIGWSTKSLLLMVSSTVVMAADLPEPVHTFDNALVIDNVRKSGRNPSRTDAIESRIVQGTFEVPEADETITTTGGSSRRWRAVEAREDGWINDRALRGGYAICKYDSPIDTVMLLDARGHSLAYVNGAPRAGDPYRYGSTLLPVRIRKGENTFLFLASRGGVKASLRPLPLTEDADSQRTVFFLERDDTLPDVLSDRYEEDLEIAVVIVNAGEEPASPRILAERDGRSEELEAVSIPPMTIRKVGLTIPSKLLEPVEGAPTVELTLKIADGDERAIRLPVKQANDKHRVTFRSDIDGSVQYYAVVPRSERREERPGLILSLHGAGVEAQRQASCYAPKDFAILVAPTNRRTFGFDWEDWGRWDAMEVLEHASSRFVTDRRRQWVTGHSMGGHGTWHLGATFPDKFAAVAPSAGWVSFWSYAGAREFDDLYPLEQVLYRAASGSDTLALKENYESSGIYILHGDKDDNVSVDQARTMREELADFHTDFVYYEQPGAGHWWGDQCMDWPPLIDFLEARSLPDFSVHDSVEFTSASPSISSTYGWAEIMQQTKAMVPSRFSLRRDREGRSITGTTENISAISFEYFEGTGPISVTLDGTTFEIPEGEPGYPMYAARDLEGIWHPTEGAGPMQKSPTRGGPFKNAFRNRMVFVVGTGGTPEETRALWEKARFDAEQWWYRGNGSVDVVADETFLADHDWRNGRNVILFGNADTNKAWGSLVDDEVHVDRTGVRIGEERIEGDDLAVLMVRPIPGDPFASVAVVAGTGDAGTRLVRMMPYWVSGIGYPDLIVFGSEMLDGDPTGIRAAGFFGNDWTIENGEIQYPRARQR